MACGAPVVTSNISALPETVGDGALTVDPFNVDEIADGLILLLSDDEVRERLIHAGLRRAAELSWDAVAERTLAVYEEVV